MSKVIGSALGKAQCPSYYRNDDYHAKNFQGGVEHNRPFMEMPVLVGPCPQCKTHLQRVKRSYKPVGYECSSCGYAVRVKCDPSSGQELPCWTMRKHRNVNKSIEVTLEQLALRTKVMKPFSQYYHKLRMLMRKDLYHEDPRMEDDDI